MRPELITFLTALLPIFEIRGAIPVGLSFGFSPLKAFMIGFVGNALALLVVMFFWRYACAYLMRRFGPVNRFFTGVFARTRQRHSRRFESGSLVALAGLVSLPLPFTGGYTGVLLAFLFDLPLWPSYFAILVGTAISGALVTYLSLGIINFI